MTGWKRQKKLKSEGRMEHFAESVGREIREAVRDYFQVPSLQGPALACAEEKLRGGMPCGKLTVLHYHAFGGSDPAVYRAAAAVELMILGADIIDDLQDRDDQDSAWNRIRPEVALNIAVGMTILSQQLLLTGSFPLERVHLAVQFMNARTLAALNGQTTDLLNEIRDEEDYLAMIREKSAGFVVAACMIGTVLATGEVKEEVAEYAEELGMAEQIKNDANDLLNRQKGDLLSRKRTLSTLFLLQYLPENSRWIADYFDGMLEPEEMIGRMDEFERVLEETGAYLYTSVMIRTRSYRFVELVNKLDIDAYWKNRILALAE
ncbi:hypothetical protein PSTEL_02415 [Paenibacillus stellifer]|uniref:Polyprenyl synthetase n=1 Tax=Paenibacillus stellifer TaxID=169760 RepID=A0A089LMM0_9BACL|nr:polyprenyl synthetase family protein [Paenibacillus stellifer]AIQ62147.1 hypothetical protein PSTEL_02415 [Paenibacillus stellifer]